MRFFSAAYVLAAFAILSTMLFSAGCGVQKFETQQLRILLPPIPQKDTWDGLYQRKIFYIDGNNLTASQQISIDAKFTNIAAHKSGAIPVLVCAALKTSAFTASNKLLLDFFTLLSTGGSAACPFMAGAVYPDNALSSGVLQISEGAHAAAARIILIFIQRGGNANALNVPKLYTSIEKYAPSFLLDANIFLRHAHDNTLSVRAVKLRSSFTIDIPPHVYTWISSWGQPTSTPARFLDPLANKATFTSGVWLFVKPDSSQYGLAIVNEEGEASFIEDKI